jgi:quinol monooxygenase YgiN
MHIVLVYIHVLPDRIEDFRKATLENARNSILEPGITRFDVVVQKDDPSRFVLIEVYHTPEDQLKHRETAHYLVWKDAVTDMMAEPRYATICSEIFPDGEKWK